MISEHTLTLAQQVGSAIGKLTILKIELESMLKCYRLSSQQKSKIENMISKIDLDIAELRK